MKENEQISVYGARVHNLKNIDVNIPRNSLTVITGLSGSGKSSLAFDTLFAEGQRRYIETFSAYARNFLGNLERPNVDEITGLSPVISIEQKTTNKNPRSTVGTQTEVYDYIRLLYARAADAYSYETGERMVKYTEEQI
ncbi:MAG: excinuclease ABC subunit UvrA, partial [Bacteroidales bacterium]|nr:excinuclease ABC subunit UvrA [Bacteroidales bacterium]